MAFWMDPLLLLVAGVAVARLAKHHRWSDWVVYVANAVTLAVAFAVSVGLFVNLRVLEPVWTGLGAETGTAFMINGLVFGLVDPATVWADLGPGAMFGAIVLFALYPFWLRIGVALGWILVGRTPDQEGLVGLVQP